MKEFYGKTLLKGIIEMILNTWKDIESAPKNESIVMKDEEGFVYAGEYDHVNGRFARYTSEGIVEHQHAISWHEML